MKNSWLKITIAHLFLALFISIKMAGLHAFFHSDEDNGHINHCKVCEHVVLDNLTPSLASYTGDFEFDLLKKEITQEVKTDYNFVVISARDTSQLFSRPPPAKK